MKNQKVSFDKSKTFFIKRSPVKAVSILKKAEEKMLVEQYSITPYMMYMVGFYDRYGKACTIVRETERIFVVDQSPLEILEYSIKKVGYNLKGAMETSREANGNKMCPIMVNPLLNLVIFPTQSAKRVETMWFNPNQIHRTYGSKFIIRKTNIEFRNGLIINIDSRLSFFNDKLKRAEQYRDTTIAAAKHSFLFMTDPKNRKWFLCSLLTLKCLADLAEIIY